jgi:hypothetical protein
MRKDTIVYIPVVKQATGYRELKASKSFVSISTYQTNIGYFDF